MPVRPAPFVHVVTWCKSPDVFYGNALVFETIRTGFPTARITVIDNCSEPSSRAWLALLAAGVGARFVPLEREMRHWEILEQVALLALIEQNEVCFVDPDVVFWESVEGFDFGNALLAGRLIPAFEDEYSHTSTMPRTHTSMLLLPDLVGLRREVNALRSKRFEFDPFRPYMAPLGDGWVRWDTGAALYRALGPRAAAFTEEHLNAYDHLFCGTHYLSLYLAQPDLRAAIATGFPKFQELHETVRTGGRDIRGAWRFQDEHFGARALNDPHLRALCSSQGGGAEGLI